MQGGDSLQGGFLRMRCLGVAQVPCCDPLKLLQRKHSLCSISEEQPEGCFLSHVPVPLPLFLFGAWCHSLHPVPAPGRGHHQSITLCQ